MANAIDRFPVSLIFKKILTENLSGELVVKGDDFVKRLFFSNGYLEQAISNSLEDRLGILLLRDGKISGTQLEMLEKMMNHSGEKFGKLLVKHKIMDKQALFISLQAQAKQIAISTFPLRFGEWAFRMGKTEEPDCQKFKIDLYEIIAIGNRRVTDFSYYKRRFGDRAPITLPIPEWAGRFLDPDDIRLYIKLSRCNIIGLEHIVSIVDMEEEHFWQRLSMMFLMNVIDFTEFRIDSKLARVIENVDFLHKQLKANTINHYELLELKNTASVNDVRERYFSFTKKFDLDRLKADEHSTAKEKADFVMERAEEAYNILIDEAKKKEYDTGNFQKTEVIDSYSDPDLDMDTARRLYLKAQDLYEESRYREAAELMEKAVHLDNSRPEYYLLLGIIQCRIPEAYNHAEKNLVKASHMEPGNADAYFYLGQLYWNKNLLKKAEKQFKKALEINMEHTLAARMINQIEKQLSKKTGFSLFHRK